MGCNISSALHVTYKEEQLIDKLEYMVYISRETVWESEESVLYSRLCMYLFSVANLWTVGPSCYQYFYLTVISSIYLSNFVIRYYIGLI